MYIYAVIIIHNGRFRFLPSMCRLNINIMSHVSKHYVNYMKYIVHGSRNKSDCKINLRFKFRSKLRSEVREFYYHLHINLRRSRD